MVNFNQAPAETVKSKLWAREMERNVKTCWPCWLEMNLFYVVVLYSKIWICGLKVMTVEDYLWRQAKNITFLFCRSCWLSRDLTRLIILSKRSLRISFLSAFQKSMHSGMFSIFEITKKCKFWNPETWENIHFPAIAQWNVSWGFVSLWKRQPTTWFRKFFDIFSNKLSLISIQLTLLRHRNSIELKKDSIFWWKCQKFAKSRCRPTFSLRNKTSIYDIFTNE